MEEGHYALASENYCHFTSPIRRYPDLTIHRQLDRWVRTGKASSDETELAVLGDHCSKMERRAEMAERELIKVRLLTYMSERIGLEMDAIITGVADYGFFAQAATLPVEGLVHISTLPDDYYYFEEETHSLIGRRAGRRYRLGDHVRIVVVRGTCNGASSIFGSCRRRANDAKRLMRCSKAEGGRRKDRDAGRGSSDALPWDGFSIRPAWDGRIENPSHVIIAVPP